MKITQIIISCFAKLLNFGGEKPALKDIQMRLVECYVDLRFFQDDENVPESQVIIDEAVEYVKSTMECIGHLVEDSE